jgi:hypothetical protein
MVLAIIPLQVYAGEHEREDIARYLQDCRTERSTPFIQPVQQPESYTVGKHDGHYVIGINVQLRYAAYFSVDELAEARQIMERVKTWIADYYHHYGLHLNIHFEHAAYNPRASNPHPMPEKPSHVVYIRRDTGSHMKKTYWGVNREWDDDARARIITHEFSHLLNLKDEYLTLMGAQSIKEEAHFEDDSLMKNVDHPHPRLYLRHIQQIVAPLCQPSGVMVAQDSASGMIVSR